MRTEQAMNSFLDSRRSRLLSKSTIDTYEWALTKMAEMYPEELPQTKDEVQRLFIEINGLSPASMRTIWHRLRIFWGWAEREGICANIMSDVSVPVMRRKLPRILSSPEITHLLRSTNGQREYAILAVLLDTGMRVGELASMTRDKVGPDGILVSGKTGDRIVPISQNVLELLEEQGDERGLWIGCQGKLTGWGLQQIVRRIMRNAGFKPPKIGPHTLRHTFGVQYIINGGDVFSLQRIMGHQRLTTTMVYVDMSTELVARQHAKFSPMANVMLKI